MIIFVLLSSWLPMMNLTYSKSFGVSGEDWVGGVNTGSEPELEFLETSINLEFVGGRIA